MPDPRYDGSPRQPHCAEAAALLARLPQLTDPELVGLAATWTNGVRVARARSRALAPDTVMVIDILRAFDDIAHFFAEDLDGEGEGELDPAVVSVALKAARDAVAGVLARPTLSRRDAALLTAPWRAVIRPRPAPHPMNADVTRLLDAVRGLSARCHDARHAATFERLLVGCMTRDREAHGQVVDEAFRAAVATHRHRVWSLIRTHAERGLSQRCRSCPPKPVFDSYERERVAGLCADAACGLLVADRLDSTRLDFLLEPLRDLVPFPRPPLGA